MKGDNDIKRAKLQGTTSVVVGAPLETRSHLVIPSFLIQKSLFNNIFSDVEVSSDEDVINSSVPAKGESLVCWAVLGRPTQNGVPLLQERHQETVP